jgi:zinc transport system substrate-binding protein
MPLRLAVLLVTLGLGPLSAGAQTSAPAARLRVAVSILPQAWFVERIGGECVTVDVLVGPGQSPHAFEPSPRQMTALADARAYVRIGIDFEQSLVPRLERMFPNLRIVDQRTGVPLRPVDAACDHDHEHEQGHDHADAHGAPDPHIWLSPPLAKTQAQTIADALVALDPARAATYRANLAALHADLDRVHAELAAALAPLKGRELFVFHPAFGYFADAYGLKQVPVEVGGKEPTPRQLAQLIERARSAGVQVIFVQPQFPQKSAAAVARAINGAVVPMDDLARDYLANLSDMAAKIKTALAPSAAPGK